MKHSNQCHEYFSVIDVGSNTLRLLIGCIVNNKLIRSASYRSVTRLGKGLLSNHELNNESIDKSINSLLEFKKICEQFGVKKVFAVGTSALRDSKNTDTFLKKAKSITDIDIEVISGDKEAELTLKGVLSNFNDKGVENYKNKILIIDIGGGSTEWIFYTNNNIRKGSLPLGAIKLYENFITKEPPNIAELKQFKEYLHSQIITTGLQGNYNLSDIKFVATGGTPTTLAAIDMGLSKYNGDKINMHKIDRPTLQAIFERLIKTPLIERNKIIGLEPNRTDIIITGTLILQGFMEFFNFQELIVSDYGLLEGLLLTKADILNHENGV